MRAACICLLVVAAWAAGNSTYGFELDITRWEARKCAGDTLVGEMAIGDRAQIERSQICVRDRKLYVPEITPIIVDRDRDVFRILIEILLNSRANLIVEPGNETWTKDAVNDFVRALTRFMPCTFWDSFANDYDSGQMKYIEITTINGHSTSSALIEDLQNKQ